MDEVNQNISPRVPIKASIALDYSLVIRFRTININSVDKRVGSVDVLSIFLAKRKLPLMSPFENIRVTRPSQS